MTSLSANRGRVVDFSDCLTLRGHKGRPRRFAIAVETGDALAILHGRDFEQDALGCAVHRHLHGRKNRNRNRLKNSLRRAKTLARWSAPVLGGELALHLCEKRSHASCTAHLRRSMLTDQPSEIAARLRKDGANLARAMTDMLDAFDRKRGRAQQVVRVERVVVENGGQAIVGTVNAGPKVTGVGRE